MSNKEEDLENGMPADYKTKRNVEDDKVLIKYFDKLVKLDLEGKKSDCKRIIQAFNQDELRILSGYLERENINAKTLKLLILNGIG